MRKFNSAYKKIILQQKTFLQKLKNKSMISQANPFKWIGDQVLKPIGGSLEGVADTVAGLATADLKKAGAGLQKTVQNPVKLVTNVIKAPVDIVDGAVDLVKSGNVPPQVQQAAKQIPPAKIKIIVKKNPNLAKLPPQQQAQAVAAAGIGVAAQQAVQATQKQSGGKNAAAAKLTDKEQELVDILAQAAGIDANKAKALFLKWKAKGKVIIYNGKIKKLKALSLKNFTANPDKYIAFAKKVNLNSDDAQMQDDYTKDEEVQNYVKLAIPIIAKKLQKDPKMIETRMNRRIKKGQLFVIGKDGKVTAIKIEDFKKNADSYIQDIEDKADQTKKNDQINSTDNKVQKLIKVIIKQKPEVTIKENPDDPSSAKPIEIDSQDTLFKYWEQIEPQLLKQPSWKSPKGKQKLAALNSYILKNRK